MLSVRQYEALTWDIFDLSDAELAGHLKHVAAVSDGEPWTSEEKEMYVLSSLFLRSTTVCFLLVAADVFDL